MAFLNWFKSEIPGIIDRLGAIGKDIENTKGNLARLIAIENQLSVIDMAAMIDSFNVALWAKDLNGRFLFANNACCDAILKCSLSEALNLKNGDFKKDALSRVCMRSDQKVLESNTTRRFIEYAVYEGEGNGEDMYLDVVKNPLYEDGRLIGTTGSAIIVTEKIPERIKRQTRKSNSIEIPVDSTMSPEMFIGFLERRKETRDDCGETSVRSGS